MLLPVPHSFRLHKSSDLATCRSTRKSRPLSRQLRYVMGLDVDRMHRVLGNWPEQRNSFEGLEALNL